MKPARCGRPRRARELESITLPLAGLPHPSCATYRGGPQSTGAQMIKSRRLAAISTTARKSRATSMQLAKPLVQRS